MGLSPSTSSAELSGHVESQLIRSVACPTNKICFVVRKRCARWRWDRSDEITAFDPVFSLQELPVGCRVYERTRPGRVTDQRLLPRSHGHSDHTDGENSLVHRLDDNHP